jgi:hypothetical protein
MSKSFYTYLGTITCNHKSPCKDIDEHEDIEAIEEELYHLAEIGYIIKSYNEDGDEVFQLTNEGREILGGTLAENNKILN